MATHLVEVRRDLPEVRHGRRPRHAVLVAARKRKHLVAPLHHLFEPAELLLERGQLRCCVLDRRAVRRQHRERCEGLEIARRGGERVDPLAEAVVPLAVEPGVEDGAVEHEVAREREPAAARSERVRLPNKKTHRAGAVAGGFRAPDFPAPPFERIHLLEGPVDGDRLDRWPHVAGAVHGEFVGELWHCRSERERLLEQFPLVGRRGHLHAAGGNVAGELRVPLALLAVVVGVEHPVDLRDADLRQGVEHAAVTQVDEDGGRAVLNDVDVAGVGPDVNARGDLGKG